MKEEDMGLRMLALFRYWNIINYFYPYKHLLKDWDIVLRQYIPIFAKADTRKSGYINFSGKKYGKQSYLLTIPSNEIVKGEYGIFFMNIITATAIPVGTFSVK